MYLTTANALENPLYEPALPFDRATIYEAELGEMKRDLVAMTVLFRLLSYAVVVRSMESSLGEEGEEGDAGPDMPPMSPEDWISYA